MKQHKDCNFSYAGLKTQVRLAIESKHMYVKCVERGRNDIGIQSPFVCLMNSIWFTFFLLNC